MPARRTARRFRITAVACCLAAAVAVLGSLTWARADRAGTDAIHLASAAAITTAWRNGAFADAALALASEASDRAVTDPAPGMAVTTMRTATPAQTRTTSAQKRR